MKYLYRTLKPLSLDGADAILRVKTDGTLLHVTVSPAVPEAPPNTALSLTAEYGGVTRTLTSNPFRETRVTFPYDDGEKALTLSGMTVEYGGAARTEFTWRGAADDPDPEVDFSCPGVNVNTNATLSWTFRDAAGGRTVLPAALYADRWSPDGSFAGRTQSFSDPNRSHPTGMGYVVPGTVAPDARFRFSLCAAAYESDSAGAEEFTGLCDAESPIYTVSPYASPYAPHSLSCRRPVAGGSVRIMWSASVDPLHQVVSYELERSVNGGEYALLYQGSSTSFTDTAGQSWENVSYRVRARTVNTASSWCVGAALVPLASNLYIGCGGRILPAAGVRLGQTELVPVFSVG